MYQKLKQSFSVSVHKSNKFKIKLYSPLTIVNSISYNIYYGVEDEIIGLIIAFY